MFRASFVSLQGRVLNSLRLLFGHFEALFHDEVEEDFGEQFVVLARVAHVGEYLSQSLLVVLGYELPVLGQTLFFGIEALYILGRVVAVALVVNNRLEGQAVYLAGMSAG